MSEFKLTTPLVDSRFHDGSKSTRKRIQAANRAALGFESDVPRCKTCTRSEKTTMPGALWCSVGFFQCQVADVCNAWKGRDGSSISA
jgi:hypothetical protein